MVKPGEFQTGWSIYFRKRGIIPRTIQLGSGLEVFVKTGVWHKWIPHHVEKVQRTMNGVMCWGAHAVSGFMPIPIEKRLEGLRPNIDFRVVSLPPYGHRGNMARKLEEMHGDKYENILRVARAARDGNRKVTPEKFCSEAALLVDRAADFTWAYAPDQENITPLELMLLELKHGVLEVVK